MTALLCKNTLVDTVCVRPMLTTDLERVHLIDQLSFSLPWPISAYQYELHQNRNSHLWAAEITNQDGGKMVAGMIVVWLILDEAHIATLAVHPDFRRRGFARQLLTRALKEALRSGANLVTLEVRANNRAAQELYRSFSFDIVGHRPRYYRDNREDALIMTLKSLDEEYLKNV